MGSKDDGSTLCAVIMKGDKMVVVNVGDSRAALIRAGTLSRLTKDHKPEDPIEKVGMVSALCWLFIPNTQEVDDHSRWAGLGPVAEKLRAS